MRFRGTILKLKSDAVIVMTEDGDFITIERQPGMYLGETLEFYQHDIKTGRKTNNFLLFAASILLFLMAGLAYAVFYSYQSVYAFVDVDINPSLELVISRQKTVLRAVPFNEDGQILLQGLKLRGLSVQSALTSVLKKSEEYGFLNRQSENSILLSATVETDSNLYKFQHKKPNEFDQQLKVLIDSLQKEVAKELNGLKANTSVFIVTPEKHKLALENRISMGKYVLYTQLKEKGIVVSIDEVKNSRVSDLLGRLEASHTDEEGTLPTTNSQTYDNKSPKPDIVSPAAKPHAASNVAPAKLTDPQQQNSKSFRGNDGTNAKENTEGQDYSVPENSAEEKNSENDKKVANGNDLNIADDAGSGQDGEEIKNAEEERDNDKTDVESGDLDKPSSEDSEENKAIADEVDEGEKPEEDNKSKNDGAEHLESDNQDENHATAQDSD